MKRDTNPDAFTLLEMLTAIGVLALMMVFMFNIANQSVRGWEAGGRRMEAAQSARIGMDLLANELRYAFAGVASNSGSNSSQVYWNYAPFLVTNGLTGQAGSELASIPGSQSIFFVAPIGPHEPQETVPFAEVGYLPTFVAKADGHFNMFGGSYALVRHGASPGIFTSGNTNYQDFYYRSTGSSGLLANTAWKTNKWAATRASSTNNRTPIVDNCIRFSLEFASNNPAGTVLWTNNWTNQTNLPLGVLVTMLVLDSRSAAKLRQINGLNVLSSAVIDTVTNGAALGPNDTVARILREGVTEVRRFIPLVNNTNTL